MPTKRRTQAITLTLGKDLIHVLEVEAKRKHSSKSQVLRELVSDHYNADRLVIREKPEGEYGRPLPSPPENGARAPVTRPTDRRHTRKAPK